MNRIRRLLTFLGIYDPDDELDAYIARLQSERIAQAFDVTKPCAPGTCSECDLDARTRAEVGA